MSQQRKMERRKQKKLHLLGGEERLQVKAGDNEPLVSARPAIMLSTRLAMKQVCRQNAIR